MGRHDLRPQTYHRLPEMVRAAEDAAAPGIAARRSTQFRWRPSRPPPEESRSQGPSAFLTIRKCDGSQPASSPIHARQSVAPGRRITEKRRGSSRGSGGDHAIGRTSMPTMGSGRMAGSGAWALAYRSGGVEGLERIRYTTSHPRDMDDVLIRAHGEIPQLMPYLHLPVQSGSDRILQAMNRKHTADEYRRLVARLRGARPDLALSSDFIVGYPGETDQDFADTLRLVREIGFAQAYSFKYSVRPGTPASEHAVQIDERSRPTVWKPQRCWDPGSCLQRRIGKQPVLVERFGNRDGQIAGRGPWMQSVHFDGPDALVGRIVPVEIVDGHPNSLSGRLSAEARPPETERMSA